jgi:hypothetical protein
MHYEHQNRARSAFLDVIDRHDVQRRYATKCENHKFRTVHLNTMCLLETDMQKYVEMLSVCVLWQRNLWKGLWVQSLNGKVPLTCEGNVVVSPPPPPIGTKQRIHTHIHSFPFKENSTLLTHRFKCQINVQPIETVAFCHPSIKVISP